MRYDPVIQQTFGVVLCRKDRNRSENGSDLLPRRGAMASFFRCANRQRKRKRKGQGQRQVLSGFRRQGCVVGMGIQHRFHMISHDLTENHHNATNKHGNFTNNCALNHVRRPWINQSQPEICHIYRYLYYTYTCIHIHINMYIFICIHVHII